MTEAHQLDIEGHTPLRLSPKKAAKAVATVPKPAAPVAHSGDPGLAIVERFLNDPTVSAERINQAFDFYQRMKDQAARQAFDAAMADAKAEIPPIVKNRKVSYGTGEAKTEYSHEDLAGIATIVDPILSKHGLSYRFRTSSKPNEPVMVTCVVAHRLGHFEENTLTAAPDGTGKKNGIQAIGSTLTYLQRYSLKSALGLSAALDDDGKAAGADPEDGPISEEQLAELIALADEVGADKAKFCKFAKINSFAEIVKSRFEDAKKALRQRGAHA
jgi:hypothetical protein